MPNFSEAGNDTYICQLCGRELDSVEHPPEWRTDLTKRESAGNVCPKCLATAEQPLSLFEHCKQESGLSDPAAITRYMQRHYGHG